MGILAGISMVDYFPETVWHRNAVQDRTLKGKMYVPGCFPFDSWSMLYIRFENEAYRHNGGWPCRSNLIKRTLMIPALKGVIIRHVQNVSDG